MLLVILLSQDLLPIVNSFGFVIGLLEVRVWKTLCRFIMVLTLLPLDYDDDCTVVMVCMLITWQIYGMLVPLLILLLLFCYVWWIILLWSDGG